MKNQRDRMLLVLINVYIFATILYYVFLRNIVDTLPIVALLGGHVNYYALIGALCLTEAHPAMQGFITSVMVVVEIAYPLLLLFSYFIAIRKRKYKFFAGMDEGKKEIIINMLRMKIKDKVILEAAKINHKELQKIKEE